MMAIRAVKVGVMSTTVFSSSHLPGHSVGSDGLKKKNNIFALPGRFLGYGDDQRNEGRCDASPAMFSSSRLPGHSVACDGFCSFFFSFLIVFVCF